MVRFGHVKEADALFGKSEEGFVVDEVAKIFAGVDAEPSGMAMNEVLELEGWPKSPVDRVRSTGPDLAWGWPKSCCVRSRLDPVLSECFQMKRLRGAVEAEEEQTIEGMWFEV